MSDNSRYINGPYTNLRQTENFIATPTVEIVKLWSFTSMNWQGSRVEKNTLAQRVQMRRILLTNDGGLVVKLARLT